MLIETGAQSAAPAPAPSVIGRHFVGQVCLVLLMITIVLSGFLFTNWNQESLIDLREGGRQTRIAQEAPMGSSPTSEKLLG